MASGQGKVRIGTSGWQYDHWRGVLYPQGLAKKRWLEQYAGIFDTVEINSTFYGLQKEQVFDHWRERVPGNFIYTLKFSRLATHQKRLKNCEGVLQTFLSRAGHLQEKLGPVLVQLPPGWDAVPEVLDAFLAEVPDSCRVAVEFRNSSWLADEVFEILSRRNAALCIHDMLHPHPVEITSDFSYFRFHGVRYAGCYSDEAIAYAAELMSGLSGQGLDVYAYFNNDIDGHAVRNAYALKRMVLAGTA